MELEKCPVCGSDVEMVGNGRAYCSGEDCHLCGPNNDTDGAEWNQMCREMAIGQKVLAAVDDGMELDDNGGLVHHHHADQGGPAYLRIWLKRKKPTPRKGLKWLKSLPVGTRFMFGGERYAVTESGLFNFDWNALTNWKRLKKRKPYFDDACPETCLEWEPRMNYECTSCGAIVDRCEIKRKVIHNRRPLGLPDDDMEDDYLEQCPECGAAESFVETDEERSCK